MVAGIRVVVTSTFGSLSRGQHTAWCKYKGQVKWAAKDSQGRLVLDMEREWHLYCTDGFSREATAVLRVRRSGKHTMKGDTVPFRVVEDEAKGVGIC